MKGKLAGTTRRLRDQNQTLPLGDRKTQDHIDLGPEAGKACSLFTQQDAWGTTGIDDSRRKLLHSPWDSKP